MQIGDSLLSFTTNVILQFSQSQAIYFNTLSFYHDIKKKLHYSISWPYFLTKLKKQKVISSKTVYISL